MRKYIFLSALCLATEALISAQAINVTATGVGVGTTTPAAQLHIKDPGAAFTAEVGLARFDYYNGRSLTLLGPLTDNPDAPFTFQTGNALQFRIDQTNAMIIDASGNLGIGTINPGTRLQLGGAGSDGAANGLQFGDITYHYNIYQQTGFNGLIQNSLVVDANGDTAMRQSTGNNNGSGNIVFMTGAGTSTGGTGVSTIKMRIDYLGNVGIGTINPTEKLTVNGKVKSRGYITDTSNWSDYVFNKDYKLPTLTEVEQHIAQKGHLPGIPSEKEAVANGVDLGDMQVRLLAQIEQLTLHMIAHEKAIDALKQENATLRRELKATVESDQHNHASRQ